MPSPAVSADPSRELLRAFRDRSFDAADAGAVLAAAAAVLADHAGASGLTFAEALPGGTQFRARRIDGAGNPSAETLFPLEDLAGAGAAGQPIVRDGRVLAVLTPEGAADLSRDLLAEFAERVWSALTRVRAEAALRERERSQAFLIGWSDALRWADGPDDIMAMTLERIGRHAGALRVTYAEYDDDARTFTTRWNWTNGGASLVGLTIHLDDVDPRVQAEWLRGSIVRYDDVAADPRADVASRAIYAARGIGAFVSVPLVRGSSVRAILSVQSGTPRCWGDAQVALFRDVGERTWASMEQARAAAELRARDRDQRFVIDWFDEVRGETDAERIVAATAARLGAHFGVRRVAYSRLDLGGDTYTVVGEWAPDLSPTLGLTYPAANLSEEVRRAYLAGEALVSADLSRDPRLSAPARAGFAANGIVARIGVPLTRDGTVQAVLAIDSEVQRAWSAAEIGLARDIAERMWVLLHRAQAEESLAARQRDAAFLIAWGDAIRGAAGSAAIIDTTLAIVGAHLGADRASYAHTVADGTALAVTGEWRPSGTASPLDRRYPLAALGETIMRDFLTREAVVVHSILTDPRFDAGNRPFYEAIPVGAFISVPLVRGAAIEAVVSVQSALPRRWTAAEVQLLRDVADRCWSALERARSEERLAESEALLTAFMDNAPLGMHLKDADGRYLRANPELARQIGAAAETVAGASPADLLPAPVAARAVELERRAQGGEVASAEFHFPDRADHRDLLSVVFPIGRRGDARTGGFTLDLTASKAAEAALRRSRDALHQSEKLSALGSLLAGVSHELNNPLSIVVAQAVMMERQATDPALAARAVKVRKAADRCARIVQTFLAMARHKRPERAAVDLNAVADAGIELTGYGLRSDGVVVERHFARDLPAIAADADQLHQIVVNLLVNAQHAMEGREGPRIITVCTARGDEPDTVVLEVVDTGPGVPEEVARRMFEPFFTTKDQGEGTGLGLSFSQGMAEAHGGRLALVPSARGARFRLTLPIDADQVLPAAAPAEPPVPAALPLRRALVVDDEPGIAEALADFLWLEGYRCDRAGSGREACDRIAATRYDLIVSDLRMPGMDGPALYGWVRREHPAAAARMGFVTGDTLGTTVARFLVEAERPVLEKPFSPDSVRRFLAELAGSPGAA